MSSSEDSTQKPSPIPTENNPNFDPWRKHRIFAGILTIYVGYQAAMVFVLSASIARSYNFLSGVMSGLGATVPGITIPLPAVIIFITLLIGGLMYCGKKGRGRFAVWFAALICVPISIWGMYLLVIVPGIQTPGPDFISLFIDLVIGLYLVWVLWKTSQSKENLRDRVINMVTPKNIGMATIVVGFLVAWIYSGEISHEYNKEYWEPSDQLTGLSIGMSKDQFRKIKGKFYGCRNNICSWHYRSNKRPDLIVYLENEKIVKIHTISPGVTGDKVPFDTVAQMIEILGQEDIRSEFAFNTRYTYLKWNISYEWSNDVLTGISLGDDNWSHYGKGGRYYIKGRQVCPSEACPWDDQNKLKPAYENASYRDFLSPSQKIEAMLANAKDFENESNRKEAEAGAIKNYQQRAEQGEALAQYRLGAMYYRNGKNYGATQDYPKAIKWLRLAAAQDYSEAQHNLGKMYEEGLGLTQDFAEAMKWYRLAAEKRFQHAMSSLGSMYMNGKGVPKNHILAYKWFQLSAMGDNDALANREILEKTMTEDEKSKANAMANEWYEAYMNKVKLRQKKRQ